MTVRTIRIPDELDARIKAAAAEDKRSVNSEIEWMLEAAVAARVNPDSNKQNGPQGEGT